MFCHVSGADPYCIIRCERHEVRSHTMKDSLNPEFDTSALFYRKNPQTVPIKINVSILFCGGMGGGLIYLFV